MITVIVFVHEMGHYLVARWNGIAIHTFSLGFGPELAGFNDRHGTRWRLSAIPLGGYVRFVGDMNAASVPDREAIEAVPPELRDRLFINKNVWQRIAVVVAGPLANGILTFVVLYALLLGYGRYTLTPVIGDVVAGEIAAEAGILPGDTVISVDGFTVRGFEDFQRLISTSPGRPVSLVLERSGETVNLTLTPEATELADQFGNTHKVGRIGVTRNVEAGDVVLYRPSAVEAVGMTFEEIQFIFVRSVARIEDLFTDRRDFRNLGGPVEVAKAAGEVASLGLVPLVTLIALVSLSVGMFNLLPIPMLDGGHLAFYLTEAALGRPLSLRAQEFGYRIGFATIMSLLLLILVTNTIPNTIPSLVGRLLGWAT
ncbi:MAG: RIP metalloprotease [Devosia sp.]